MNNNLFRKKIRQKIRQRSKIRQKTEKMAEEKNQKTMTYNERRKVEAALNMADRARVDILYRDGWQYGVIDAEVYVFDLNRRGNK